MTTAESAAKAGASGAMVVLLTLASGQFLMTLDSSVMNVSIATVAKDVGTTVTGIEGAITAYVGGEKIEVAAGSYAALPKNVPHGLTVRGEEARLLITLEPAGAEYLFVPRDDADADPARYGLIIQDAAPTV